MTTQQLGSYLRQGLALLGVIFGVLTASVGAMKLPTAVSTVLTVGGAVILAVEHYVSDPSTGGSSPGPGSQPAPVPSTSSAPSKAAVTAHTAP